eukprot:GHVU01142252.1.p1 GENE.GHVU01142252.1~~GHVU01142252.1.p1  ORF type:complete len:211 (+),score=16.66 GHVU01142252.1:249-881(+)
MSAPASRLSFICLVIATAILGGGGTALGASRKDTEAKKTDFTAARNPEELIGRKFEPEGNRYQLPTKHIAIPADKSASERNFALYFWDGDQNKAITLATHLKVGESMKDAAVASVTKQLPKQSDVKWRVFKKVAGRESNFWEAVDDSAKVQDPTGSTFDLLLLTGDGKSLCQGTSKYVDTVRRGKSDGRASARASLDHASTEQQRRRRHL